MCSVVTSDSSLAGGHSLRELSLAMLQAEACAQELRFGRWEPIDQAAGLELFRRAIRERNDDAWCAVIAVYRDGLIAQAGHHVLSRLGAERVAACVDLAFERFWQATRAGCLQTVDDLASILKYLKLCFGSVLVDEARARRRRMPEVPLEALSGERSVTADVSSHVVDHAGAAELWHAINQQLANTDECLVAYLSFVGGLAPAQIAERCPDRFETVFQVYRIKRNILVRLRNSPSIQRLRDAYDAVDR